MVVIVVVVVFVVVAVDYVFVACAAVAAVGPGPAVAVDAAMAIFWLLLWLNTTKVVLIHPCTLHNNCNQWNPMFCKSCVAF